MYNRDSRIETKVGFFVLLGLAVIAGTVVYFGRLGQGLQEFYDLQVDFPNASGLLSGSDVLLGGARIGYVAKPPRVLPAMQGVAVELKIREDVALPSESRFIIGSSGLLGNRFVDVIVDPSANLESHLAPGAVVQGQRESGIEDLTRDSSEMLAEVRSAVKTVNETLDRINSTALSQESLDDLRQTIANLKKGSEGFTGIGTASKDLEATAAEARKLISSARTGPGPLPMLLNDRQASADLRAILANIRRHGVLWYKDSYRSESSAPPSPRAR
ncbi:MAG: MCE family protein [Chthoniobacterales bacterium]|nr:MCE family protein [Chthoniobacterales bacterium]